MNPTRYSTSTATGRNSNFSALARTPGDRRAIELGAHLWGLPVEACSEEIEPGTRLFAVRVLRGGEETMERFREIEEVVELVKPMLTLVGHKERSEVTDRFYEFVDNGGDSFKQTDPFVGIEVSFECVA